MMMQDYMMRQGYLSVVIRDLKRVDYLRIISKACDGDPGEFVSTFILSQLEGLQVFYSQHLKGGD
jgi:hypothetical protein